jgi:hypothetical protein
MRVQGETSTGSPCAIFVQQKEGRRNAALIYRLLGRFLRSLGCWPWHLLCLFLRSELLPYLGSDGVSIHFVGASGILENGGQVAACCRKQNARFHQQPGERSFIRAANEGSQSFADASIVAFLTDAVVPRQHLHAVLVHDAYELFKDEQQVTFHETNGNGYLSRQTARGVLKVSHPQIAAEQFIDAIVGLPRLVVAAMLDLTGFLSRGLLFPNGKLYLTGLDGIALTWIGASLLLLRVFKVNMAGVIGLSLLAGLARWFIHIN